MENVVAQWAELLLQKPQVGGSNQGSSKLYYMSTVWKRRK